MTKLVVFGGAGFLGMSTAKAHIAVVPHCPLHHTMRTNTIAKARGSVKLELMLVSK